MLRDFKGPDRKGPRFSTKSYNPLSDKEFYDYLTEEYPRFRYWNDQDIKKIVKRSNEHIWEEVIEERNGVELQESLGFIFIGSCPSPKKVNINYRESIRLGKQVLFRNYETDGHLASIFYTNYATKYAFKFRDLWSFKACRNFTKGVSKTFPTKWNQYIKVEKGFYIYQLFKDKRKKKREVEENDPLAGYYEFDGF